MGILELRVMRNRGNSLPLAVVAFPALMKIKLPFFTVAMASNCSARRCKRLIELSFVWSMCFTSRFQTLAHHRLLSLFSSAICFTIFTQWCGVKKLRSWRLVSVPRKSALARIVTLSGGPSWVSSPHRSPPFVWSGGCFASLTRPIKSLLDLAKRVSHQCRPALKSSWSASKPRLSVKVS